MTNRIILIIMVLALSSNTFSQKHIVSGFVKDIETKEPVQFANVWIEKTYMGVSTDINGYFSLEASIGDIINISSMGYNPTKIEVKKSNKNGINVYLQENITDLDEILVKPDIDYAKVLFKRIINNKKHNRNEIYSTHNYKNITNTTIYLAIDTASSIDRFVDNIDDIIVDTVNKNLRFLPIYLSEEANDVIDDKPNLVYSKKNGVFPKLNQTIESIILQYLVVDLNFYQNQLYIFDRGIVSPISDNALLYYNIYLNDSSFVDGNKLYNFSFSPKNKFAPLFTGHFSVYSNTYSLSEIEVYFKNEANINFVNGFKGKVSYKIQPNGKLFLNQQHLGINLSLLQDKDTTVIYGSQRIDDFSNGNWLLNKRTYYSTSEELEYVKARNWKYQTEFKSEEVNSKDYQHVEKIKKQPIVKAIDAIGGVVLTSYINTKLIDIGPVFDIYSTNAIEGNRFSVPVRTGENMFEFLTIGGFLGYGTKSNEFKYGANIGWQPFKKDKYIIHMSYDEDYTLISQDKFLRFIKKNPNAKGNGNFIAAVTTRERDPYLKEEKSIKLKFEYNADENFDLEVSPYFAQNYSTPIVRFVHNDIDYKSYQNYGALINLRLAF
ncbi:MAG: carboxypeptidase-like regulatory domain-containing protein, partial [Bacteroidetes bacterium]